MHERYQIECVLETKGSPEDLRQALLEFGENINISPSKEIENSNRKLYVININTTNPTFIFDICGEFGKIKCIKIKDQIRD